jgi:AcrR family transcriptional regulator
MNTSRASATQNTRHRIVQAAAELLAQGGREAVSTRLVAEAAQVQAPTIYRLFGDMRGLLDAVACYGFALYLEGKVSRVHAENPVEDIRQGWDAHVGFGLANPALYTLMYGEPRPGGEFTAALQAMQILLGLVERVAEAGRLRLGVEQAAQMIHAASQGVTLSLLGARPEERDLTLSTLVREAILTTITLPADSSPAAPDNSQSRVASRAVALKAVLPEAAALSPGERTLLSEWLDRLSHR